MQLFDSSGDASYAVRKTFVALALGDAGCAGAWQQLPIACHSRHACGETLSLRTERYRACAHTAHRACSSTRLVPATARGERAAIPAAVRAAAASRDAASGCTALTRRSASASAAPSRLAVSASSRAAPAAHGNEDLG